LGLIAIAVGMVAAVAIISVLPNWRIDLTEDRLYSIADGTRNIVQNLERPIELMFFYSDSATEDQPQIRSYGTRVTELLEEIVIASNGNLSLTVIDPEPFSEDEDLANQFGIQAVPISQGGESIYFGLVAAEDTGEQELPASLRVSETMPLIRPDQEEFLEYEFMKLIANVANPDRPVVGVMTGLDVDGGFDPMRGQATPPWMIMDIVRQLYEARRVATTVDSIDEDVDILMLVHPSGLSEQALYAVDQFVMRGGNLMLFLDPNADSMVSRFAEGNLVPAGMASELPRLLEAWGISFDNSKVLTDSDLALRVVMTQGGRPSPHLGMLGAQRPNLAQEDVITSRLETVNFSSAGSIAQAEGTNTRFEPLVQSSSNAMMMESAFLQDVQDPSVLFDEFESTGSSFVIAARVSGSFDSAFPDGAPVVEEEEASSNDEATDETVDAADGNDLNPAQPEETAATETADTETESEAVEESVPHLASTAGEVNMLVFADTDFLSDRMWVQVAQFLGQRIPQPFANNGDLIINALDNLSGGADLVSIRSRGRYSRPFTRVMDLQREADDRLRLEEAELLQRLDQTQQQIDQLSLNEDGTPIGTITPEIQAEIDGFNQDMIATRRRLRDVQFQLTEDIEQLGARLKLINSAAVPVLLTLIALAHVFLRSRRRKAAAA
ncbi:MAG: Gldg family protein, partial [Gammaproteobacteria bacterium]